LCSGRRSLNLRRGKAVGWAFGSPDTFYAKARGPARVSAPSCFGTVKRVSAPDRSRSGSRSRSSSVPGFVPVPVLVLVFVLEVVPVLVEGMGTGYGDGIVDETDR